MAKRACLGCGSLQKAKRRFCDQCGTASPVSLSSPRPAGGRPRAAVKSAGAGLAPVADLREARIARYWQEVRAADGGERQQPWIAMILDEMNVGAA